jgi:hypothetical protein
MAAVEPRSIVRKGRKFEIDLEKEMQTNRLPDQTGLQTEKATQRTAWPFGRLISL